MRDYSEDIKKAEQRAEERGREWLHNEQRQITEQLPFWRWVACFFAGLLATGFFAAWGITDQADGGAFWPIAYGITVFFGAFTSVIGYGVVRAASKPVNQ